MFGYHVIVPAQVFKYTYNQGRGYSQKQQMTFIFKVNADSD